MIVYGPSLSPFVRKVMAVIAEKGLTAEMRAGTRPGDPDPAFRAISPTGKVPGFEDGDYKLADSSAIVHYLDARYPEKPMLPADPEARGRVVWFDEYADTIAVAIVGKLFFNRVAAPMFGLPQDLAAADAAEKNEVPVMLAYLESQMTGDFLVGGALTLADISVATVLINLHHGSGSLAGFPKTEAFYQRMIARPSLAGFVAAENRMFGRS